MWGWGMNGWLVILNVRVSLFSGDYSIERGSWSQWNLNLTGGRGFRFDRCESGLGSQRVTWVFGGGSVCSIGLKPLQEK